MWGGPGGDAPPILARTLHRRSGVHMGDFHLVGGAGFVGAATARYLRAAGFDVTVVDRAAPADQVCDVLVDDLPDLPPGRVVLLLGASDPRAPRRWTLPVSNALATARLLPLLQGRDVTLVSTVEVYGAAAGPLTEDTDPVLPGLAQLDDWCADAIELARDACPDWRAAPLGLALADLDPGGRWVYGLAKLAQERLVRSVVPADRLTVLRPANVVGVGQERVVTRFARRAVAGLPLLVTRDVRRSFLPDTAVGRILADGLGPGTFNVGAEPVALADVAAAVRRLSGADAEIVELPAPAEDSGGQVCVEALRRAGHTVEPLESYLPDLVKQIDTSVRVVGETLPVVVPPRPERPDLLVARQQEALLSGAVKHGNRWTQELHELLTATLDLDDALEVVATSSGTAALRLLVAATAGRARPGDVAVLPSFTFTATAEVLLQLGYELRYADVDPDTWTLDPAVLPALLADGRVRVVVAVDTFGVPCRYAELRAVCDAAGVAFVADSAAALGSAYDGSPVAGLADGHSYSMSFAKVLSASGAGGALVLPREAMARLHADPAGWTRSELMTEMHAIAALDQLAVLERMVAARERVADIYGSAVPLLPGARAQQVPPHDRHSRVHWVLSLPNRDQVQDKLLRAGVGTKPYFPALHLTSHPVADPAALPVTEALHTGALALPMSSEITDAQADAVVFALARAVAEVREVTAAGDDR